METIKPIEPGSFGREEDPLKLLARCGGYYECPKDPDGKRLGPLVGYAGKYIDSGGKEKQYVGDVYANFAKAERHAPVLRWVAEEIDAVFWRADVSRRPLRSTTGFCGAPEGGKALAVALANRYHKQYIFPEKKVTFVSTKDGREVSELVFDRHEPDQGDAWWIVEDVCNNFSTTAKLIALIEQYGAKVAGILCFLNRSLEVDTEYRPREGLVLPVIAVVRKPIPQYRQDDPEVATDIAAGNVVWKPKNEWHKIEEAMRRVA